jgi:hypothetical protein
MYRNIPDKIIRQLASNIKIKHRGLNVVEIIEEIQKVGHGDKLDYLENQFRYARSARGINICKPESKFPTHANTPEKFIEHLIKSCVITEEQLETEWQPELKPIIQLCAIHRDGNDVYLKMVEKKTRVARTGYDTTLVSYASHTCAVIHFSDEVFELRCAFTYRKQFVDFIMKLMGFPQPYKWYPIAPMTKEEAKNISLLLQSALASTQIAMPTSVGSLRFNAAEKGVDLRDNPDLVKITSAISSLGLPTDDTLDEIGYFEFTDPVCNITLPVSYEINLVKGGFKFNNSLVTESVIEQVLVAFIKVCFVDRNKRKEDVVSTP